ncbi:hypothetical protein mRhiFer1_009577 [Rhinolophus ferrumequinum]|uniref:RRM domain-containing protein n=1 Tax=Rhinolophus ferrumequinum TaxID=59479 RepID=A0A7J7ZQD1_RHIFE|nr:hypothetical protein mRhiFer1_009577 [Rhinolophus ferrumequinum]
MRRGRRETLKEEAIALSHTPIQPKRDRAFVTIIRFDVAWQSLKDRVKEKGGEVIYVELLMDTEGKPWGCAVVEFKMEDSMKKAAKVLNKHSLSGRPLKAKEDLNSEHDRRAMQTAGRLGSTVLVANLDYKIGCKKLKEIFSKAGVLVQAFLRVKTKKNGGISTVTFEQSIEAISMFNV